MTGVQTCALPIYSLTNTIEKGIKIHLAALLGRFTIPLTAMVTPMNVNDSNEVQISHRKWYKMSMMEIKRVLKYYGRQSLQEARRVHPMLQLRIAVSPLWLFLRVPRDHYPIYLFVSSFLHFYMNKGWIKYDFFLYFTSFCTIFL